MNPNILLRRARLGLAALAVIGALRGDPLRPIGGPAAPAAQTGSAAATRYAFSDPSRPGTLRVRLTTGALRIHGADGPSILVASETPAAMDRPRSDGLRVLTVAAGYSFRESGNVAVLTALGRGGRATGFNITVPRNTNIIVSDFLGGTVKCSDLSGSIEVKSLSGAVKLDGISGGALVETMNGPIEAHIRAVQAGRPLSFTSMNGKVVIWVPADAKATVRLRTQNGEVLTDFDERALVMSSESETGMLDIRGALQAARDAMSMARDVAGAARDSMEADGNGSAPSGSGAPNPQAAPMPPVPPAAPAPPIPEVPPMPALPSLTGGKTIAGTLNGGGPEIQAATMNGDVILRKEPVAAADAPR